MCSAYVASVEKSWWKNWGSKAHSPSELRFPAVRQPRNELLALNCEDSEHVQSHPTNTFKNLQQT